MFVFISLITLVGTPIWKRCVWHHIFETNLIYSSKAWPTLLSFTLRYIILSVVVISTAPFRNCFFLLHFPFFFVWNRNRTWKLLLVFFIFMHCRLEGTQAILCIWKIYYRLMVLRNNFALNYVKRAEICVILYDWFLNQDQRVWSSIVVQLFSHEKNNVTNWYSLFIFIFIKMYTWSQLFNGEGCHVNLHWKFNELYMYRCQCR